MAGLLAYLGAGALAGASQGASQGLTNATQWGGWWNLQALEAKRNEYHQASQKLENDLEMQQNAQKQQFDVANLAYQRGTAESVAQKQVEGEKLRGQGAAEVHAKAQLSLQQGEMGMRQFLQQQELAARRQSDDAQNASREKINAQDRAADLLMLQRKLDAGEFHDEQQFDLELRKIGLVTEADKWVARNKLAASGNEVTNIVQGNDGSYVMIHRNGTVEPMMIDDKPVYGQKNLSDAQKLAATTVANQIKANQAAKAKMIEEGGDPTDIDALDNDNLVLQRQLFNSLGIKQVTPAIVDPLLAPTGGATPATPGAAASGAAVVPGSPEPPVPPAPVPTAPGRGLLFLPQQR